MQSFAGRFELLHPLGRGGMGEVFLARDLASGTQCALKRLIARPGAKFSDVRREFELLARIRHPAVVSVFELGFAPDGTPFYTMEYVRGISADQAIARGDWPALFFVAGQVTQALEALHGNGLVHGDLKPSNLLVTPPQEPGGIPTSVRLLDFGLALALGDHVQGHRGTAGYAPPEVVRGESARPTADLYGFGATLFRLVAGRAAFDEVSIASALRRQQEGPPSALPLEEADAPPGLVQLILRMMAPDPSERPRDAREIRRELELLHPAARRPLAERLQTAVTVGRERELSTLQRRVAHPSRKAHVTLISGEAGIGKSILLRELAARVALEGREAIVIACRSLETPGEGAVTLLRRLSMALDRTVAVEDRMVEASIEALDVGEDDLETLVQRAIELEKAIAKGSGPPVILLDDVHELDSISRSFMRRLALHPESPAAVHIWTIREAEGPRSDDLRVLIEAGRVEALPLAPLQEDDVKRLVGARLHETAPESLIAFLWSRARGNPGLTVELMLRAAATGALREAEAGTIADPERLEKSGMPEDFETSLRSRSRDLGALARPAAEALATLRSSANLERLRALDPRVTEEALVELERAGLARRDAEGFATLASRALCESILDSLDDEARRALHRRALELDGLSALDRFFHLRGAGEFDGALEAAATSFDQRPDLELAEAAAELAERENREVSREWRERAARELSTRGRYQAAIAHLDRALEGERDREATARRLLLLSTAHLRSGAPRAVASAVARALDLDPAPGLRSRLLTNDSARLQILGDYEAAKKAAEEALALAESVEDEEAVGVAAQSLVYSLLALRQSPAAEEMVARAATAYERIGHVLGQIRSIGARAAVAQARSSLDEAVRLFDEALAAARSHGMRLVAEELLNNLGGVLSESGQWTRMREVYGEAARFALEDHRPRGAAVAIANLAQADCLTGRPRVALRQARAAIRLAARHAPWLESFAWRSLAQAHRISGRTRRAERSIRRALDLAAENALPMDLDWTRIEYGRLLQSMGRWRDADALWEGAIQGSGATGSLSFTILLALAGRAALRVDDVSRATLRLGQAEERLKNQGAPYASALTSQLRAELSLRQDRIAEGMIQAEKTMSLLKELPAPPDRAAAALEFSRLALSGRLSAGAPMGEWLEQASGTFARLGDRRGREHSLGFAVQWLKRTAPARAPRVNDRGLIEAVSRLLNSLSDLKELTQRTMQMVVEQLGAERGVLLLSDPETGRLDTMAEFGAVDARLRSDAAGYSRRVVQRVAESGGALLIGDAPSEPGALSESMVDLQLRSIVCVPMYLAGRVVGAVYLDDSRRPQAFGEAERGLLEGFAHLMAVAIEKSRGHEEVQRANELLVGENLSLRQEASARFQPHRLIGTSLEMQRVLAMIERAALAPSTVLLTGENGTGKELIARILHHSGKRRLKPFVAVNCGAIPESLLESELFGILPNVATGVRGRDGRFKQADGGTLFLDEVGDMPVKQQVALLSAIANREITPVGGGKAFPVDVRIIAATNRDLRRLVEQEAFREDLFYRLNVIPVEVPPLRERKADIPSLAQHFVAHFAKHQERDLPELSADFMAALMQSDWPGNVRELQNYIERVMAMNPGKVLHPVPLPRDLEARASMPRLGRGRRLTDLVEDLERRLVEEALAHASGNQSLAARQLGVPEQAIRYRIRKYGLGTSRQNQRMRLKWR